MSDSDLAWHDDSTGWLPLKEGLSTLTVPLLTPSFPPPPPVVNPLATNLHVATPETTQFGIEARAVTVKKRFFTRKMGIGLIIATLGIIILLLGYHYRPSTLKTDRDLFTGKWHLTKVTNGVLTLAFNFTADGENLKVEGWFPDHKDMVEMGGKLLFSQGATFSDGLQGPKNVRVASVYDPSDPKPMLLMTTGDGQYVFCMEANENMINTLEPGLMQLPNSNVASEQSSQSDLTAENVHWVFLPNSQLRCAVGSVTNNSTVTLDNVHVDVNFYDAAGNPVGSMGDDISNLEPEKTWTFHVMDVSPDHNADSFKVMGVSGR